MVNYNFQQYLKALSIQKQFNTPEQIAFMEDPEKNRLRSIQNYITLYAKEYEKQMKENFDRTHGRENVLKQEQLSTLTGSEQESVKSDLEKRSLTNDLSGGGMFGLPVIGSSILTGRSRLPDYYKNISGDISTGEIKKAPVFSIPGYEVKEKMPETPEEEKDFLQWYMNLAKENELNLDPYDKKHHFDYFKLYKYLRAAAESGSQPTIDGHFLSKFKEPDHPNRYIVEGSHQDYKIIDTITEAEYSNSSKIKDLTKEQESVISYYMHGRGIRETGISEDIALSEEYVKEKKPGKAFVETLLSYTTQAGNDIANILQGKAGGDWDRKNEIQSLRITSKRLPEKSEGRLKIDRRIKANLKVIDIKQKALSGDITFDKALHELEKLGSLTLKAERKRFLEEIEPMMHRMKAVDADKEVAKWSNIGIGAVKGLTEIMLTRGILTGLGYIGQSAKYGKIINDTSKLFMVHTAIKETPAVAKGQIPIGDFLIDLGGSYAMGQFLGAVSKGQVELARGIAEKFSKMKYPLVHEKVAATLGSEAVGAGITAAGVIEIGAVESSLKGKQPKDEELLSSAGMMVFYHLLGAKGRYKAMKPLYDKFAGERYEKGRFTPIEKLTKNIRYSGGEPGKTILTADTIRDIISGRHKLSTKEQRALFNDLGLERKELRKLLRKKLDIKINIEPDKIIMLRDKPYWQKAKKFFKIAPTDLNIKTPSKLKYEIGDMRGESPVSIKVPKQIESSYGKAVVSKLKKAKELIVQEKYDEAEVILNEFEQNRTTIVKNMGGAGKQVEKFYEDLHGSLRGPREYKHAQEIIPDKIFELWLPKTVADLNEIWLDAYAKMEQKQKPLKDDLVKIKEEYESSVPRSAEKKEMKEQIEDLKGQIEAVSYDLDMQNMAISEKVREEISEVLQEKYNITDENTIQEFTDEFFMTIYERPGIEWSWDKTVQEVFNSGLDEWGEEPYKQVEAHEEAAEEEPDHSRVDQVKGEREESSSAKATDDKAGVAELSEEVKKYETAEEFIKEIDERGGRIFGLPTLYKQAQQVAENEGKTPREFNRLANQQLTEFFDKAKAEAELHKEVSEKKEVTKPTEEKAETELHKEADAEKQAWEMTKEEFADYDYVGIPKDIKKGNVYKSLIDDDNYEVIRKEMRGLGSVIIYKNLKIEKEFSGTIGEFRTKIYGSSTHKGMVSEALSADKEVPVEVLKEYPDLAEQHPVNKTWKMDRTEARNFLTDANMDLHRRAIKEALEVGLIPYKGWEKDYPEVVKEPLAKEEKGESVKEGKNNYAQSLFKKIDKWVETVEENDEHNLLSTALSNIAFGNLMRLKEKTELINSYFEYSPDVFDKVKDYEPQKLIKFLERIVKSKFKPPLIPPSKGGQETVDIGIKKDKDYKEIKPDKPEIESGEQTTLKEQKKYIINAIDEAIDEAPIAILTSKLMDTLTGGLSEKELEAFWAKHREVQDRDNPEYVYIEVPGDGEFILLNDKQTLLDFKKRSGRLDRKESYGTENLLKGFTKKKITQKEIDERTIAGLEDQIGAEKYKQSEIEEEILDEIKDNSNYYRLMNDSEMFYNNKAQLAKKISQRKSQIADGKKFGEKAMSNLKIWEDELETIESNIKINREQFDELSKTIDQKRDKALKENKEYNAAVERINKLEDKISFVRKGYDQQGKEVTKDDLKMQEIEEDFEKNISKASKDSMIKAKDRIGEIAERLASKHNISKGNTELYDRVFNFVNERFGEVSKPAGKKSVKALDDSIEDVSALAAKTWQVEMAKKPEIDKTINKTEILKWIEKTFKIPIKGKATQRFRKQAGLYYPKERLIRLAKWGELEVLMHELAHHVDYGLKRVLGDEWKTNGLLKKRAEEMIHELCDLDYDQKRRRSKEGYAEFMRYYLTTNQAPIVAPLFFTHFQKFLDKHPELKKNLIELRSYMDIWQQQGAEKRIFSQIDYKGEHTKPGLGRKVEKVKYAFMKHWIDELYPFKVLSKEVRKRTGKKLPPTKDPFELATYSKSKASIVGRTFVMKKAVDEHGNILGPGLAEILKPISDKEMKSFIGYAVCRRAELLAQRGIESGFDIDDVRFMIDKYGGNETWNKAIDDITEWSSHLLGWIQRAGGLSENEINLIQQLNPIYVPFKRAFMEEAGIKKGKGKFADTGKGLYKIRGSARPIINPMESLINMASDLVLKAQKIRIGSALADLSKLEGMGDLVVKVSPPSGVMKVRPGHIKELEEIIQQNMQQFAEEGETLIADIDLPKLVTVFFQSPTYTGKENIVSVWKNGKREFYEVHPELYQALMNVSPLKLGPVVKIFSKFARLLRLGATSLKVSFGLARNPWRDAFTYSFTSQRIFANPLGAVRGLVKYVTAKNESLIWRAKGMGLELSGMMGMDRAATMRAYDEMMLARLGAKGKVLMVVKHPVDTMRMLFNITEMGPRIAELENMYKTYLKDNPEWSEEDAFIAAFNDAQDVTINFTKGGDLAKIWNEIAAFFKVSILGPEKVFRTLRDRPLASIIKGLLYITSLSIATWFLNKDKDWYSNLPPSYKYSNIWFEINDETIVRLPIPFDLGIVFAAAPAAALDYAFMKDDKAFEGLGKLVAAQIPDPMPTMFGPMVDVGKNKNWLGVPIESEGEKRQYHTERRRKYTTAVAVLISRIFDKSGILKLSPIQIDYMMNAYTGGFFRQFDFIGKKNIRPVDAPVLADLLLRMPERPKRQLDEFFSEYELLAQRATSNLISTEGELAKFKTYQAVYNKFLIGHKNSPGMLKILAGLDPVKDKNNIDAIYKQVRDLLMTLDEQKWGE